MKIDGGCHCGNLTYEAEIDPEDVRVCHCTDCQTISGSAFRTAVPVPEDKFKLSGSPKTYVKTAESGNKRAQVFCPECGTHLYATSVGDGPKIIGLRVTSARQRNELVPRKQMWFRSALPWVMHMGAIDKVEKDR